MLKTEEPALQPGKPGTERKVKVTVLYTGQNPYVDDFAPQVPLETVKRKALHKFGIEESAADQYALQYEQANQDDKKKVGDYGDDAVTFTLVRINPQQNGYGRRAC